MSVDNVDLDPTPYVTPLMTPMYQGHSPMHSDQFSSFDLGLNPSSIASNQSDVDNNNNNKNMTPLWSPSNNSTNEMKSLLPPTQQQSFHLNDKYKSKSDA